MTERYSILIVDDELPARRGIRNHLLADKSLEIIGECSDGVLAIKSIEKQKPDIVILDIQMPGMTGLDVLRRLKDSAIPVVIFVTAYNQYALEAFEVRAIDYVLKPIDADRFLKSIARAKELCRKRNTEEYLKEIRALLEDFHREGKGATAPGMRPPLLSDTIPVRSSGKIIFVKMDTIDWVEATRDYSTLHCGPKKHLIREGMADLETILPASTFLRIHRSTIVNATRIVEMRPRFSGDYIVVLQDGTKLVLTRTHSKQLDILLNRLSL